MWRIVAVSLLVCIAGCAQNAHGRRLVVIKVDGMNADLLFRSMQQINPETGRSEVPWITRIFGENGMTLRNFYTRGISLSAPSWSELDTGCHTVIRGNVEYDRYTGHVYDYLNFFPFYLGYARMQNADMPGVKVLDRAGIPLLLDRFPRQQRYQSFQLFQRGVRWNTLTSVLKRKFSSGALLALLEGVGPSLDQLWMRQTETEVDEALRNPQIRYVDFFTGDVDHEGHANSDPRAMQETLHRLDALCGRLWTAIQRSPEADNTILVMVSDHGMNNVPGVISQSFSLPAVLGSISGGAHHVITDRHEFSDFKLRGLDPLVNKVVNPSGVSLYLKDEADEYPTAWVDLDGNERASVCLRDSELNKIHILLQQLSRKDISNGQRLAGTRYLNATLGRHRTAWQENLRQLREELAALQVKLDGLRAQRAKYPHKPTRAMRRAGTADIMRRMDEQISAMQDEVDDYRRYCKRMEALLSLRLDATGPFTGKIEDLVPEHSLGERNSLGSLQHYVAGPGMHGIVPGPNGSLDEERSFLHVNYFDLFAQLAPLNNPQKLARNPVDFAALAIVSDAAPETYWLTSDAEHQLLILKRADGDIALRPVAHLHQDAEGHTSWDEVGWSSGLPLRLFEDPSLRIPAGSDRGTWLSGWHSEREWFEAIAECRYSNGVIGITEQLSPVENNVPGRPGTSEVLLRYERRRRALVQPDFQLFASDHWNFNVRNVNPGGNHGSFLRISTHSVWMMAGASIPAKSVDEPHDSLDFAPCLLQLAGMADPIAKSCPQ